MCPVRWRRVALETVLDGAAAVEDVVQPQISVAVEDDDRRPMRGLRAAARKAKMV